MESVSYQSARITGVKVNYFFVCKRKLWLFDHFVEMEHTSDYVELGQLLHQESFPREKKREILIDELIRIDFIDKDGVLHDVKSSKTMEDAHTHQLLYYLYYLKQKGVDGLTGQLNYPKAKRKVTVELTPEREQEIESVIKGIQEIVLQQRPPEAEQTKLCAKCSYAELCWS